MLWLKKRTVNPNSKLHQPCFLRFVICTIPNKTHGRAMMPHASLRSPRTNKFNARYGASVKATADKIPPDRPNKRLPSSNIPQNVMTEHKRYNNLIVVVMLTPNQ